MTRQLPTPYDGSSKLFQIGLKPLDPAEWIDVDERLEAQLAAKDAILAKERDAVFKAEPGTESAQAELLALLLAYLPSRFPDTYRRDGDRMLVGPDRAVALTGPEPPLLTAARLVQEDLILLRRDAQAWRVVAGFLAFPSSWSLTDKIGRPMHEVHGPVPGFGAGSRPNELIGRMFDNLRPEQPVIRWNWSLYGDDELRHTGEADPAARRFGAGERAEPVFLRVERQTLRRLERTGAVVFGIRVHQRPLRSLESQPAELVLLREAVEALPPASFAYKGVGAFWGPLREWLISAVAS